MSVVTYYEIRVWESDVLTFGGTIRRRGDELVAKGRRGALIGYFSLSGGIGRIDCSASQLKRISDLHFRRRLDGKCVDYNVPLPAPPSGEKQ